MIGLGTIINAALIVAGGIGGALFGKLLNERIQTALVRVCGVSTLFIGMSGALSGMFSIENGAITGGRAMFVVLCMVLGAVIGEALNLERLLERFGEWLKIKTGNAKDANFVNGFVTASLTVCIGAMAIIGSIQDGIAGDWSILAVKGVLDLVIIMAMTCSMGKGCAFSAIPVFLLQGSVTLLATLLKPIMTDAALANISLIGSILIFCVGVNLIWDKRFRVANLLPCVVLAAAAAFLPFSL